MRDNKEIVFAIQELKEHKERGFDVIYQKTNKLVFSIALAYVKDYNLAKDIVQETYLQFLKNLNQYNQEYSLNNYLMTIAKNLSLNVLAKRKHESSEDFIDKEWQYKELIEEPHYDFDTPVMDIAKKHLSEEELQLLLLIAISGYKRKEVAAILQQPISTITWKYNQVIQKMQGLLKKEGYK